MSAPSATTIPEVVTTLLTAAVNWKASVHRYHALQKAHKSHGWAANVAVLPLPPSTNMLFPGKARRFKSPAYKAWEAEAGYYWQASPLSKQPAWPLDKSVNVLWTLDLYVFMPYWRGDLDNKFKAAIDFLCKQTGLRDSKLVEIHAKRITGTPDKLSGLVLAIGLA